MSEKEINIEFDFTLKTHTICGEGKALQLNQYLVEKGYTKPGIIVDFSIFDLPYVKKIIDQINKDNLLHPIIWKYDLNAEPDYDSLDHIRENFIDSGRKPIVNCFVGIGGGSVIDFAKGLATVTTNLEKSIVYKGFPCGLNDSLPTIALPTTAGTGSEVTFNAVFTDNESKKKLGINTKNNFPVLAILDPLLTISCPLSVTASSGMDALVHTMESYVARQANVMNKIFAKNAFHYLFNTLLKIADEPENINARAMLQFGAYLAGISLINSGSGPAGALSYPLGVRYHVPHGVAGAVFLPYIIEHNVKGGYDYSELYDLIEDADISLSKEDKNKSFVSKFFELAEKLRIPDNLLEFGVNKDNLEIFLSDIEALEVAFSQNPIVFTVDDGKKLVYKLTMEE